MYLYFLPLAGQSQSTSSQDSIHSIPSTREAVIPVPTHDGGVEHTAARFLPASTWLRLAGASETPVILYPPQYTLLYLVSQFLDPSVPNALDRDVLEQQRTQLREFATGGDPPWKDAVTSPTGEGRAPDGREILGLSHLPPELRGSERRGIKDLVVIIKPTKQGFRNLAVMTREELRAWREEGDGAKL
jgi:hypothetical protein